MAEYISREAAIAYIREQSEECQKAFEELGGESGIYADAYNDLAEDFCSIPAADVAPVVRCGDCKHHRKINEREREYLKPDVLICTNAEFIDCGWNPVWADDFCSYGEREG